MKPLTPSEFQVIALRGEFIALAKALKVAGMVATGGHAKILVHNGQVKVNGAVELQPGKKLRAGDRFSLDDGPAWTIRG
jgi:ribosome-associated protein